MKVTIEIDAPGAVRISSGTIAEILQELALFAARRGSADFYEPPQRLHIAATYKHDHRVDSRVCGEMFLEPGDSEKIP